MKQFLMMSVLLLGTSWLVAQTSNTTHQSSSTTTSSQSSETGTSHQYGQTSANAGQTTVEGCLSNSGSKYMLTDKHGKTFELMGDSSTLAEHVGHEIKVTGTESTGAASAGGNMGQTAGAERTIEVSSVKHISKTCKSGGTGGNMSH
jgi:hypothetical protein